MTVEPHRPPPWLAALLLAEDDTEESVMGSDWHQEAILGAHAPLLDYARERQGAEGVPWYVSSQVTVIVQVPGRRRPWQPKPDLFVVVGVPPVQRTSYDAGREGPMPQFVLEVASESTWREDVAGKRDAYAGAGVREYLVFDPTGQFLGERVRAWRAGGAGFEPWPAVVRTDGQAVWESGVLGLGLRVEGALLRFDHPARGPLPVFRELVASWHAAQQALEAAERERLAAEGRAQAAEQRAQEAERALAALQEEVRRRGRER